MNKSEYGAFKELESQYETEKRGMVDWVMPTLKKLHHLKCIPGQRHHGSLYESDVSFDADRVNYGVHCCGSTNYEYVLLSDLLSNKWHKELQNKINVVDGILHEAAQKAKDEELKQLKKRLGQLEK